MQLKLLVSPHKMRYDNIKVGPCDVNDITVTVNSLTKGSKATCLLSSNGSAMFLFAEEIQRIDNNHKYGVVHSPMNRKCVMWEFSGDIDVATRIGTQELRYMKMSDAAKLYSKFNARGSYVFRGIEIGSVDVTTGALVISFDEVEILLESEMTAGEVTLMLL